MVPQQKSPVPREAKSSGDDVERNRREFPKCAKIIDAFRKAFGPVKVLRVSENGKERRSKDYEV